jgi:hypothetical protein
MTLTPAYGRDYKSKKEIEADLNAGKDFILNDMSSPWDGKPINKENLIEMGQTMVNVRYGKLRKVTIVKVG